ncbi:MAG: type I pullulanase [Candidatus Sumerlaeia bacterium]|nr:type I pullulanase [Candidatus Sumerlaeia bacterium]
MSIESSTYSGDEYPLLSYRDLEPEQLLKVHYHRFDNAYSELTLWTWDLAHNGLYHATDVDPVGVDDFGVTFLLNPFEYISRGKDNAPIGLLPRRFKNWDKKDGPDRIWQPNMGNEVWIIQGRNTVYTKQPDTTITIAQVFQDDWNLLRIVFSFPIDGRGLKTECFKVVGENGVPLTICSLDPSVENDGKIRILLIRLDEKITRINSRLTVQYLQTEPCPMMPGNVQYKEQFFTREPLGPQVFRDSTHFRVFSPAATRVQVILYPDAWKNEGRREVELNPLPDNGVWELELSESLEGQYYSLRVFTQTNQNPEEFRDPFCTNAVSNRRRARLTNLFHTDPQGFRPAPNLHPSGKLTDAVFYEVHIRDYTIHPHSGVSQKGTYLGMVEPNTKLHNEPEVTTGFDYLAQLGVTHVQLLPVHQFDQDELDPQYDWGYMTSAFFSPAGWYASGKDDDSRIREFKSLIREFHSRGIGIILDVVLNHSGFQNTLEHVAPRYYHRTQNDGTFFNGSGCGNEIHTETPMGRQLILQCCRYWAVEYGVDGFRFDLMGLIDLKTLKIMQAELKEIRPGALLYGEPWIGGPTGRDYITDKAAVSGQSIGAFNDTFRNAIKGEPDGYHCGYVQNGSHRDEVIRGLQGSVFGWARSPQETVNYVTCHDNLTLWDKLQLSTREDDIDDTERRRMHLLSVGILAVAQGGMFLHGGCEFFRSKRGHHNTWNAPDFINQYDWPERGKHSHAVQFVQDLIQLRLKHPLFRLQTKEEVANRLFFRHEHLPVWSAIHLEINGQKLADETWSEALILINPDGSNHAFQLPERSKPWKIVCFDFTIWHSGSPASPGKKLTVPRRSLCILAQETTSGSPSKP